MSNLVCPPGVTRVHQPLSGSRGVARALAVLLAISCAQPSMVAEAASPPALSIPLRTKKGFVTDKMPESMTLAEGSGTAHIAVTDRTRVLGLRATLSEISLNDVVRVEGELTEEKRFLAVRIEVLFIANGKAAAQRPRIATTNILLSWILNGGIIVPLP